ncbi:GcrA family cell cycle regulator [Parasaccharibacter apium]|nr:GcrA family cell cycle regulator [Parasaccharibacter apium]
MAMEWTDELIARLKELWEQGLSTAEIGRQLSITKNAVVGKAHRLGLPPRPSPIRNKAAAEGSAKPARTRTRKAEVTSEAVEEKAASAAPAKPVEKKKAAAPKVVKVSPAAAEEPAKPASVKADRPAGAEKPAKASAPKAAAAAPAENPKAAEPAARPAAPVAQRKVAPPRRVRDTIDRTLRQGPTCQWPLGDPGTPDFHFCGATPLPGKPYCAEHAAIAYVKIRDRRH